MSELKNEKHEAFCQNLIKYDGGDRAIIMTEAGLKDNSAYFSHLKNLPHVKARVLELRREAGIGSDDAPVLTLQQRLEMLTSIASDPSNLASIRIKALAELHRQCGVFHLLLERG